MVGRNVVDDRDPTQYVPFFDVAERFVVDHRDVFGKPCGEGEPCGCAPSTPEEEYLLSSAQRTEQIEALLATQGRTVELCGPCNTLIVAGADQEKRAFWARHSDCEWDDKDNERTFSGCEPDLQQALVGAKFYPAGADELTAPMVEVAGVATTTMLERAEDGTARAVVAISVEEAEAWLARADAANTVPLTVTIHGEPVFEG